MNCTQCNTEISHGASFCPQCGTATTNKPIFPSDPLDSQSTGQHNLLIGILCVIGALFLMATMVGGVTLTMWMQKPSSASYVEKPVGNTTVGTDLNLYGKTIGGEDFDWESLRGKYVLVKFTATWCVYCKLEIPGMREAYEKYHDKGLEIVSVYTREPGPNAAETIKQYVEKEQLPWIILSEPLTLEAGQPAYNEVYAIRGVPTMLIVDKEGKVLAPDAYSQDQSLQRELKKLFGE